MRQRGNAARLVWVTLAVTGCGGAAYEGSLETATPADGAQAGPPAAHEAPPTGPATLEVLLHFAARHAPRLAEARAALATGRAEMTGARAPSLGAPEVEVAAGARRSPGTTGLDVSVDLRQPFEVSGARGARIDAARLAMGAARAEVAVAEWEVHRAVHAAFHDAVVAREEVTIAGRLAAFSARVTDFARHRVQAGESAPLELRVAEGESAQAAQELAAAEGRYREARIALAAECGWPPQSPPEPAGALEAPRDPPALDVLVSRALTEQVTLRQAGLQVARAGALVRVADREAWPPLSVGVGYAREGDEDLLVGTLGGALPIFATNQAGRARARAEVVRARAALDAERAVVPARVARAHAALTAAVARVRAYGTEILPRFEESLNLLTRALELGEIDVVELSVASGRFLAVQRDALSATADYHRALAELEAAVGAELETLDGDTPP